MHPREAYKVAINAADIEKCQEAACKDSYFAYLFAKDIPGADIEKCQEVACKDPYWALLFALDIPGADIKKCQEAACVNPYWAYQFVWDIPKADIDYCITACKDKDAKRYYNLLTNLPQIIAKKLAKKDK